MRSSKKEAGRLGPASLGRRRPLGRKRPGRAHPQPYVGPRMLGTPRVAANRLLIGCVSHRHWNAPGKRYCQGVLAQFFRTHREQFFHFRCPRGCWWRKRRAATAYQGGAAIAALEPGRCEGLAGSWGCLTHLLGALGRKGGRPLGQLVRADPRHFADQRPVLAVRETLSAFPSRNRRFGHAQEASELLLIEGRDLIFAEPTQRMHAALLPSRQRIVKRLCYRVGG
jgi:hypothetical protein